MLCWCGSSACTLGSCALRNMWFILPSCSARSLMMASPSATARSWEFSEWKQTRSIIVKHGICSAGLNPFLRCLQLWRPPDDSGRTEAPAIIFLWPKLPVSHSALHARLFSFRLSTCFRELPAGLLHHVHYFPQGERMQFGNECLTIRLQVFAL